MQAVILAAGEGTRLRPLTWFRPKAMIPVANRPIIGHVIDAVRGSGIKDIVVVVGYRKEQIIRFLSNLPFEVSVVIQEKPLGTANALKKAQDLVHEDFLVLPGDNFIDSEAIRKVIRSPYSLLVMNHPNPSNFGVVTMKGGLITSIVEKPERAPSLTVSTGILSLPGDAIASIRSNHLTDEIASWLLAGIPIRGVPANNWFDAIYPWDLIRINQALLTMVTQKKSGRIDSTAVIRGPVLIGDNAVVGPYTTITGPVVIGDGCVLGPHACIGPYVSIGARTVVRPFSVVSDSILMDDVEVRSHSVIMHSVIGSGVHLAEQTTATKAPGTVEMKGQYLHTSFGLIAGDQAMSGPGTSYQNAVVGISASIKGHRQIHSIKVPDEGRVI